MHVVATVQVGGEEFAIIVPDTGVDGATVIAQRDAGVGLLDSRKKSGIFAG
jgi:GGDEF domain-containing protein